MSLWVARKIKALPSHGKVQYPNRRSVDIDVEDDVEEDLESDEDDIWYGSLEEG